MILEDGLVQEFGEDSIVIIISPLSRTSATRRLSSKRLSRRILVGSHRSLDSGIRTSSPYLRLPALEEDAINALKMKSLRTMKLLKGVVSDTVSVKE